MLFTVVIIVIVIIIRWSLRNGHHVFVQLKCYSEKTMPVYAASSSPPLYSDDLFVLCLVDHVSEGVQGYAQLIQKVKLISELQSCQYRPKEIAVPTVMHLKGHYQSLVNRNTVLFTSHIVKSSVNQILLNWQEDDLL